MRNNNVAHYGALLNLTKKAFIQKLSQKAGTRYQLIL
jgi:hypothetical protein